MLHELQTAFLKGIYNLDNANAAFPYIQVTMDKSEDEQLSIYRGSIFGGLKKALAETYPVTKELVGDDFFNMLLGQYIKTYPCKVHDLNDYGEELPEFIQNLKQARSIPYLADVALLEWHCNVILNTKVQKNNLADLSFLNVQEKIQLRLSLQNGSTLFQSCYPVDKIWGFHQNDSDDELEIVEELVSLLVWKNEHEVRVERLSIEQFYFLEQINRGITFVDVCNNVSSKYLKADIDDLFATSLRHGWLQSYEI